jgi:hypothetical protein
MIGKSIRLENPEIVAVLNFIALAKLSLAQC